MKNFSTTESGYERCAYDGREHYSDQCRVATDVKKRNKDIFRKDIRKRYA